MIKALRTFRVRPSLPPELLPLAELAGNLRWAWHPPTRELFRWADPDAWAQAGGNPVELLGRLSHERLTALAGDEAFLAQVRHAREDLETYLTGPRWAQSQQADPFVAYFSPEFGITHVMQTYSGGLGVLAGDHLKAASDLGLSLAGVGLLYRHGYFRQRLDADGWQQERYPDLNPFDLPLDRLERDGEPETVRLRLGDRDVLAQVWVARVGRITLLLLDTDLPANAPDDRVVTDKLYGGDVEHRLRQEIVLGIGGVRAVRLAVERGVLPSTPEVFHSNEGHAGFLQLERIRRLVTDGGLGFEEAVESARAGVLFTTHTPVPAGIDVFPRHLMEHYFAELADELGISMDRLMAIGQVPGALAESEFNMAVMGLSLSAEANGVSRLHGRVARSMFQQVWPAVDVPEVPIGSVTNGVHAPTWVGPEISGVLDRHLGAEWLQDPQQWARAGEIGDEALWRARSRARERLVQAVRGWVEDQHLRRGESPATLHWAREILDPDALTIGFARRFAEYKRGTLLLRDPDRLRALLLSNDRPVQLIFAGKAHPRDDLGKDLIRQIVHFSEDPDLRRRLVFVEDYDMDLAAVLYQGVDVWLNNPRRPHEACGTSGMKAVLNGAIHASTLDGWWDECYDGDNGFAIGSAYDHPDVSQQDAADGHALFELLERTLVPAFYDRSQGPLPRRWLERVRRSLETLGPQVLATRMVRQYATEHYWPIALRSARLADDDHARARDLAAWRARVDKGWPDVRVERLDGEEGGADLGERRLVEAVVRLGRLTPGDVRVELLHGRVRADGVLEEPGSVTLEQAGEDAGGRYHYRGEFDCGVSGEYGLTVRVLPDHEDLGHWTDTGLVAWAGQEGVEA